MSAIEVLPSFTGYEVGDIYAESDLSGEALYRSRSRKALGELGELAFSYKAASLGFGVSKPLGDNEPFDFILNTGHRLWRVQVKSTYHMRKTYSFRTTRADVGRKCRRYSAADVDVLAAWVMPLDVWYIIPVQAFATRTAVAVYPHRENYPGQFEAFREAWCLLTCSEQRTANSRVQIERCQMNENLMRPSGLGSPCPLKELLSQLESKAPGKRLRLPRRV
jgi:PD-(D/E)XK endonuclease